jgi:hypothetical protein
MATIRGLHPLRWGLGLLAVALILGLAPVAQWLFDRATPQWAGWWADPVGQARTLGDLVAGRSGGPILLRLGPMLALLAGGWCLVGGWIARHELLARYQGRPGGPHPTLEPGPTRLVATKAKELALGPLMVILLVALTLVPMLIAGRVNAWFGGGGAVAVALVLPIVLIANLVALLLAMGVVAWPLMPVTIAAETSDVFDALSRSYNYVAARPIRFLILLAICLGLSSLPLLAAVKLLAIGPTVWWLAAGLSVSIFWSLQTMVYLDLRTAVDRVDADDISDGANGTPDPAPPAGDPKAATRAQGNRLVAMLYALALIAATWLFTAWFFPRVGGESAEWLGWGLGERFAPPAEGLYRVASWIGLVWGAVCLAAPFLVALRAGRSDPPVPPAAANPAG